MRVLILGAAGVLGSALAERFRGMGLKVRALDVCRREEAWRLADVNDSIEYVWKSSIDLLAEDVRGIDIVVDAAVGAADRPLANSSPVYSLVSNVEPSMRVLEVLKGLEGKRPIAIYPSSFNALYGYPSGSVYERSMLPNPASVYGWTKSAAELLYTTYYKSYGVPSVITRVGSGYGPRMRSDELPAKLILSVLKGRDFGLRSPNSRRLWTYAEDIAVFYQRLVEDIQSYVGQTLHCAGNKNNETVTNMALARMIMSIGGKRIRVRNLPYEPGELIDGKPISFEVEDDAPLWRPEFTLREGMTRTYSWFRDNLPRYGEPNRNLR